MCLLLSCSSAVVLSGVADAIRPAGVRRVDLISSAALRRAWYLVCRICHACLLLSGLSGASMSDTAESACDFMAISVV